MSSAAESTTTRSDDDGGTCFGCGTHNAQGMRLEFTRTGPRTVEGRTRVAEHFGGQPGIIHGGIQAVLLDEVMGVAAHCAFAEGDDHHLVTADFQLRYRRPAPTGQPLVLFGELDRVDGRDLHVRGEIRSEAGEVLTRATARWVHVRPSA